MGGIVSQEHVKKFYDFDESNIIGRGNYSVVYKATSKVFCRQSSIDSETMIPHIVAIKVYDLAKMNDEEKINVARERLILSELKHPNAVKLFEFFQTHQRAYLVMEYLSGGNIFSKINTSDGFISEQEAAKIVKQLASIIAYLAAKHYVFCDIRCENIMFEGPNSDSIRLINFGLTKKLEPFRLSKSLSAVCGSSRDFVAPEVLSMAYDTQADVWGIGVLLFYLLSGNFPFHSHLEDFNMFNEAVQFAPLLTSETTNDTDFESTKKFSLSKEAKQLLEKLLHTDSERRPTAHDILKDPWILKNQQPITDEIGCF